MAILTVNSGSSSLKLAIYAEDGSTCLLKGSADSIGNEGATITVLPEGEQPEQKSIPASTQHEAFDHLYSAMQERHPAQVHSVGHRVVHGGPRLVQHQRITGQVLQQLKDAVHFAPLHIPAAIDLIEHTRTTLPDASQFACFDTAFHQTMPAEAYTYALPKQYRDAGVRRYGFHGLSYESVVYSLGKDVPSRAVVAHLGSGASACAILDGKSQDTSMGLSPTGGFPMATRPGDLDPGVVLLLQRGIPKEVHATPPDSLESMLNHDCGLKALSGETDVRRLLARAEANYADALLALDIFCREIAKTIAAYIVVLGGLDLLIFTGGIGEHSATLRERICSRLACNGVRLDSQTNHANKPDAVSSSDSAFAVRVVSADENGQIARHVAQLRSNEAGYSCGSPSLSSLIASR